MQLLIPQCQYVSKLLLSLTFSSGHCKRAPRQAPGLSGRLGGASGIPGVGDKGREEA